MNSDRIEGNWKQFKGKAQEQWGRLTDDQLEVVAGKHEQLIGKIQESYGISRDEATLQVEEFEARYRDWDPALDTTWKLKGEDFHDLQKSSPDTTVK